MKLLRFLLFPFAILYDAITSIRNFMYDKRLLSSTTFDIPVICVGNLSVGGTGKTPQIEYLINLLKNKKKVAVLSRGYKRKTTGFLLVDENHTAIDVGDEPLQYFKKFKTIYIAVDENRVNGITALLKFENPPEIILLDDAFQHRKVTPNYTILLTKYSDLFVDDYLLPTGNLRENRRGAKRANTIIVTKCPENLSITEQEKIHDKIKPEKYQKVYFTTISYANELKGNQQIKINDLVDYEVLLVTGIANPKPLLSYFEDKNIKVKHLKYPDHHHFSDVDISAIHSSFQKMTSFKKIIITTEKDYMRLFHKIENISFLEIKTTFLGKNNFDNEIIAKNVKTNI